MLRNYPHNLTLCEFLGGSPPSPTKNNRQNKGSIRAIYRHIGSCRSEAFGGEGGTPPKIHTDLLTDKIRNWWGLLLQFFLLPIKQSPPGIGPVVCERKRLVVLVRIQAPARRLVLDVDSSPPLPARAMHSKLCLGITPLPYQKQQTK